jgi:hypothetical protein
MMKIAPAVLPALVNCGDAGIGVGGEDAFCCCAVGGKLDAAWTLALFEPAGRELDEAGAELFGLLGGRGDGRPDQLKMFRSFSKKPWWC